ncbi:hypothetical protein HY386_00685 [Candidatus Daviesbacteria bacterium]|nr:hypothetical protein [Candidatus Daviesbacteria bacterium]
MAVETLTELKERLKIHQGEPVLVVTRVLRGNGPCSGPIIDISLEETLCLGICTPPFLDQVRNRMLDFTIPTPYQAVSTDRFHREMIKKEDGPIAHWRMLSGHFGRTLTQIDGDPEGPASLTYKNHKAKNILEVEVGDEEVTTWFINHAYFGRMPVYDKMLLDRLEKTGERVDLQQSTKEKHFDATVLYGYQKMRKALGLVPAILPVDIQEMVDSGIETRRLQILDLLESLYDGRKRTSLKEKLPEAIDWEMDTGEWVVRRNPFPGATLEIDVPKFIIAIREMIGA